MDFQYIREYNAVPDKAVKAQEISISEGLLGKWHLLFSESEEKRIALTEKNSLYHDTFISVIDCKLQLENKSSLEKNTSSSSLASLPKMLKWNLLTFS